MIIIIIFDYLCTPPRTNVILLEGSSLFMCVTSPLDISHPQLSRSYVDFNIASLAIIRLFSLDAMQNLATILFQ